MIAIMKNILNIVQKRKNGKLLMKADFRVGQLERGKIETDYILKL